MIITEISVQKNNKEKYNIYVDGIFRFSADTDDVIKNSLKVNLELDSQQLEKLIQVCEYSKAFSKSLKMLEMKDYSIYEVESKLKAKGFSENTVERVINKLVDLGFLNDGKYLVKYCKDSIYLKKNGLKKITYDLKKKGLSEHELILSEEDKDAMYQHALEFAQKKFRQLEGKTDIKGKVFRHLASKGYDYEIINKVINIICKNTEDFSDYE